MTPAPDIRDTCQDCGKKIPPLPAKDAYCVRCRYEGEHKPPFDVLPPSPAEDAIATTPSPAAADDDLTAAIESLLLDAGIVDLDEVERVTDRIEDLVLTEAYRIAADRLRDVAIRLTGTAAGEAMLRVLNGDFDSLEDAGRRCGKSKVAVHKSEARIRSRLTRLTK